MEDFKGSGAADKPTAGANPDPPAAAGDDAGAVAAAAASARRPFTSLSRFESDLALALVLQEQETAYMLLSMNRGGGEGSEYEEASEESEYEEYEEEEALEDEEDEEEDVEDAEADVHPAEYEDDEAYARALQDAEERELAARLMAIAGLSDGGEVEHEEDHVNDPQDAWLEFDPDEYSYEELVALGEVVGTASRGASADTISSLPSVTYKAQDTQDGNTEQCVICRMEFEEGESLVALLCKHSYHPECINQWLQINKVCPMCNAEVSTSENEQA